MLTLSRLSLAKTVESTGADSAGADVATDSQDPDCQVALYDKLASVDPMHAAYYRHLASQYCLDQAAVSPSSLAAHLWHTPAESQDVPDGRQLAPPWLRLSHMALSHVSATERFLSVTQLDLSHNLLRSCHGLEALQLLMRLDLSHNMMSHVTALAPLRSLPHLSALNVSHNRIGCRLPDTCRYTMPDLIMQPLSATSATSSTNMAFQDLIYATGENLEEELDGFRGLSLRVLDIRGNPVADEMEGFCDAITSRIPQLVWLNGEKVN